MSKQTDLWSQGHGYPLGRGDGSAWKEAPRGFWDAGGVLFLNWSAGYLDVLSLWKSTELCIYDLCTHLDVLYFNKKNSEQKGRQKKDSFSVGYWLNWQIQQKWGIFKNNPKQEEGGNCHFSALFWGLPWFCAI